MRHIGTPRGCRLALCSRSRCAVAVGALAFLLVTGGWPALGHSPTVDANLSDWCTFTTSRVEDSYATLTCGFGTEMVWWDAPADGAVNDLATVITTQDTTNLYWAAELHVDPDPISLPFAEIAIDVVPGGTSAWFDPISALQTPGRCSDDSDRLCTEDADCHFCTNSTIYTATPLERPRTCGSTNMIDSCNDFDPTDLCIRTQTCVGLGTGPAAPNLGVDASPVVEPDYLLVFDFSRWLVNLCDATKLLRADGGTWVEIPRPACTEDDDCTGGDVCDANVCTDPLCPLTTWHFLPAVDPGASGGSGGPPGKIEVAVPWEAFDCAGCVPFNPGDAFRWSIQVNRGSLSADYIPDLAVEDVMTEVIPGRTSTATDICNVAGTETTLCEIANGSMGAFVPPALPGPPGGTVRALTVNRDTFASPSPSITLDWGPSCTLGDTDYEIYEGTIGDWTSALPPASGAICSTGGAQTATFDAGAGDHFYLIVPTNGSTEGSYGANSGGTERPVSASACRTPQTINVCQ